jgi:hypothetical protein
VASLTAPLQDVLPPMADLLVAAGFRVRSGRRADCSFCEGRSRGTVAFTREVFFCHRCKRAGNRGSLAGQLGLLRSDAESLARRRREARVAARLRKLADRLRAAETRVLTRSRNDLQGLAGIRRNAGMRLSLLHAGAHERFPGESELCWEALRFVADHEARASEAYLVTAFAGEKDRAIFVLHPDQRAPMVGRVLEEGGLLADRRRWVELVL